MTREGSAANYNTQIRNAVNAGAVGVILHTVVGGRGNFGQTFTATLNSQTAALVQDKPVLGAAYHHGIWLKEMTQEGPIEIKIRTMHYSNLQSLNVIGTKPAKNKKIENPPVVVLGVHIDSVVGAPDIT